MGWVGNFFVMGWDGNFFVMGWVCKEKNASAIVRRFFSRTLCSTWLLAISKQSFLVYVYIFEVLAYFEPKVSRKLVTHLRRAKR